MKPSIRPCFLGVLDLTILAGYAFAQLPNCGTDATVYINASDTLTTYQPWHLPFGTANVSSETWVWTLDTASYNMNGPNGSAEQRLWLSTQAQVDLTGPDFGFLGCGMVMHGLRHSAIVQGQDDTGSCSSIFNAGCLRALDNSTNLTAQDLTLSTLMGNGPSQGSPSALEICSSLANLGPDGKFGLPQECSGAFLDDAWIQTFVFASPQADDICSTDPAASTVYDPLAAWGAGTYNTADMTTYDNLTTSITPLMVTLLTNRTVNDTRASQQFTAQQLMCLRPSNIEAGSASPTQIPNAAAPVASTVGWTFFAAVFTLVSLVTT